VTFLDLLCSLLYTEAITDGKDSMEDGEGEEGGNNVFMLHKWNGIQV